MGKKMEKVRSLEQNKRSGFTLVELLVAIAILGVLSVTVVYMMVTSSKTYGKLSVEAQMQSEAQLVANSISEIAIDSFNATDSYAESIDSKYDATQGKILVLDSTVDGEKKQYIVALDGAENNLCLAERTYDAGTKTWGALTYSLLGNYVNDFSVDVSRVEKDNMLNFTLEYEKDNRTYNGNYQVLMRNKAYADKDKDKKQTVDDVRIALGLEPKVVYIDVVAGSVPNYYLNTVSDANKRSVGTDGVEFASSVVCNQALENKDVNWRLVGADEAIFSLSDATGETSKVQWNPTAAYGFADSPIDSFSAVISKSITVTIDVEKEVTNAEGETETVIEQQTVTVDAPEKASQILLRRIKKITVNATSGSTQWKNTYTEMGGTQSTEAQGYAYVDNNKKYVPMTLNAAISCSNIAYGGGLTWKLYKQDESGNWGECTNTAYAKLATATTTTTTNNTVTFGGSVRNGQLYKVVATSIFDPTYSGEYIFGIAPSGAGSGDGFYSRGYYIDLESYIQSLPGLENFDVKEIRKGAGGSSWDNASDVRVAKGEDGRYYMYINYEAYQYSQEKKKDFYMNPGDFELYITDQNGKSSSDYGYTNPLYYVVRPVLVTKALPQSDVVVIQKGRTVDFKVQTQYYNLIKKDYFGIYIDDMDTNLNTGGLYDTNKYLTTLVTSSYGDVYNYVDMATTSVTAKTGTKDHNPLPMTLRFTADDYYTCSNHQGMKDMGYNHGVGPLYTCSYVDYTVYLANVEDSNVFIPTPATTSGSAVWPSSVGSTKVSVAGYNADGTLVSDMAKVYTSGSKYKCDYNGVTYTYNRTYHYWSK